MGIVINAITNKKLLYIVIEKHCMKGLIKVENWNHEKITKGQMYLIFLWVLRAKFSTNTIWCILSELKKITSKTSKTNIFQIHEGSLAPVPQVV